MNRRREKNILKQYHTISFDIFDTLIFRKTESPSDIFYLAGRKVFPEDSLRTFVTCRITAEDVLRKRGVLEASLDQIYEVVAEQFGGETAEALKESEMQCELENCYANENMKRFYEECLKAGKQVLIVSDMYHSSAFLKKMLEQCGYQDYDRLYVSNEWNAGKRSGRLFEKVLDDNGNRPMVHIGDSFKADWLGAHKAGVRAVKIHKSNALKVYLTEHRRHHGNV